MVCPVCKKDFDPHTGRRPKKFCSEECKVKYFNARKKVKENNRPENKKRIEEERNTPNNAGQNRKYKQPLTPNESLPEFKRHITFHSLLDDAKKGTLNMKEFNSCALSPNQRELILRKLNSISN